MLNANRYAFKEWAVVCRALAEGRQSLILRKGGLHEGRDGFRVEHGEFWLFPTRFHQEAEELVEDARPLLQRVAADAPPEGAVRIAHYAGVQEVVHIEDESVLPDLRGLHVWSDETLAKRFHYKRPGLFALPVRIYEAPQVFELPDSKHFAGCRSWVDLPEELPTAGLRPVLSDEQSRQQLATIRDVLSACRRT